MSLLPESRAWRIALLAVLAGFVWLLVWYFDSDRALLLRDKELLEWARGGGPSEFEKDFAAADYHDQWGHTPADVVMVTRAVRLQYPDITINAGEPVVNRDGDIAVVTKRLTITGAGERRESTFTFTWRKESLWPWSWKLTKVTAPDIP